MPTIISILLVSKPSCRGSNINNVRVAVGRRGGHSQQLRAGDAGVDAGARAVGPADRPVPGGGALGGHVRARARLLLQRQAAQPAHVRRRRQPRHHTRELTYTC